MKKKTLKAKVALMEQFAVGILEAYKILENNVEKFEKKRDKAFKELIKRQEKLEAEIANLKKNKKKADK